MEKGEAASRGSGRAVNVSAGAPSPGASRPPLPTRERIEVRVTPHWKFGETMRADVWWIQPLLVFIGLSTFIVYSTWAAFQGKNYFVRQLCLAVLFAGTVWQFAPQLVWTEAGVVAGLAHLFPCALDSLGAGWLPAHLLLLSWRLLQSVLGRSAGMHSGRAAQELLGRAFIPAHHAKCASLFSLSGALDHFDPCLRRLESALVCRSSDGQKFIRNRRRHDRARDQCIFVERLHIRMPLPSTFDRWISRSTCKVASLLSRLRLCELSESPPHALGVAESVLGRLH